MKLSIIVPVYNEEKTIVTTLRKLIDLDLSGVTKEIIVVDDGSEDKSVEKIKSEKSLKVKLYEHKKNMGKGAAVQSGIKNATGEYILIQDADLEYDPKFIPTLLEPILEDKAKVVYGTRLNRLPNVFRDEKNPLFLLHYFGNRFLSVITSVLYGQWLTDMETGYKVFPKKALNNVILRARSFDFEPEITAVLLKKGYKILEIPIQTTPRGYDEGKKLNAARDGIIALWTLIKNRMTT